LQVLLQPTLNALVQLAHVLEHHGAFAFNIESQDRVAAKFAHRAAELAASLGRKQVSMKSFTGERPRNGAVRTDQAEVEAQLLRNRQGKLVPPPGYQDDFDALFA